MSETSAVERQRKEYADRQRLRNAAPALLEALRQIADPMGLPVSLNDAETIIQVRRLARSAIAKATGQEQIPAHALERLRRKVKEVFTVKHNKDCELGDNWKECPEAAENRLTLPYSGL